MIKIASLSVAGGLLAFGLSAAPAQAGSNRTWVSGKGSGSGACTRCCTLPDFCLCWRRDRRARPRRLWHGDHHQGDQHRQRRRRRGDHRKSSGNSVTINAGASDSVHLRGLTIDGLGSGSNGIQFNTGGNLAIENCVIRNFAGVGIVISSNTSSSFSVSNTIASNNGANGTFVEPTGTAVVKGVLSKVTANNNNLDGIIVIGSFTTGASLNVTVVDSEASNNGNRGVIAVSASGHPAPAVMLRNVVASNNGIGLFASTNAILRIAHSVVTGNGNGLNTFGGGILDSYGDNDIDGNTFDNTGVLTPLAMH